MTMTWLFSSDDSGVRLGQRLLLAAVFFPHGAQKLLGWYGGYGYSGTIRFFTGTAHLPWLVAFLVVCIESFGPIALALGLLARPAALGVVALMVGAVLTTHLPNGFFMNWFGDQTGEGFEYHLLVIALALPVLVLGAGRASLDGAIARWLTASEGRAPAARLG
jgi:putative oxidoreductase